MASERTQGESTPMSTGGPANPSGYQPNVKYVLLLGLMCALPAVTSDIYLPSLPEVARDLHTTTTAVQLTMTGVLLGGAVGQLVVGPLSDRFGRRRPVLVGIALHIVISLLCALAPGVGALIALRVLQGFFNAAATVVAVGESTRLISRPARCSSSPHGSRPISCTWSAPCSPPWRPVSELPCPFASYRASSPQPPPRW